MNSLAVDEILRETIARLQSLEQGDRPRWGKMTVAQMVRHLVCTCDEVGTVAFDVRSDDRSRLDAVGVSAC